MEYIEPNCPICGKKAYVMHTIVDGFEFGWDAGCASACIDDGVHGITDSTPSNKFPRVSYCLSREAAIERWRKWVEKWRADHV